MKSVYIILILLTQVALGCSKTLSSQAVNEVSSEEYAINGVVLSIGDSQKLVSFDLSVHGSEGFVDVLSSKNDAVRDIVVSHLSNFEMKQLRDAEFVSEKLSSSFNQFFAGVEISKVKLKEIKEL